MYLMVFVQFVDGWELNGQFFPSPEDHPKPMSQRFSEFCGERKIKQSFVSAQNVALVQYRMPSQTSSFSLTVRFVKNTTRKYHIIMFYVVTSDHSSITICLLDHHAFIRSLHVINLIICEHIKYSNF